MSEKEDELFDPDDHEATCALVVRGGTLAASAAMAREGELAVAPR